MYARLVIALVLDERMPAARKALLAGAAGYLVLGRDLIPDDVPIIGGLDDLVVVVLAVDLFLDGAPEELLREKLDELGIDRARIRPRHRPDPALDAGRRSGGRIRRVPTWSSHRPATPSKHRSRTARAGLDLQGGSHRVKVILTKDVPTSSARAGR